MDPGSSTDRIVGVLTATALFGAFGALAASNGPRFSARTVTCVSEGRRRD